MAKDRVVPVSLNPESSFKRLPSFKSPRDLKLSQFANPLAESRTKKVFVPNLNIQRRKQTERDGESGRGGRRSDGDPRENQRGRRESERGRGRKKQFIQASGVFSEGLAPQLKSRSRQPSAAQPEQASSIPKPKLKLNELIKADKDEEALIMKELMRDDFVDDPALQPDSDISPIQLPLTKLEDLKIEPTKIELTEKQNPGVVAANGIRIKTEPGTNDVGVSSQTAREERPVSALDLGNRSMANILAQARDNNFIFFQIPNSIPRLKVSETTPKPPPKVIPPQGSSANDAQNNDEGEGRNGLRNLPAGRIGTLQILKSGKGRLLLGDVSLIVEPATQVAFKQELVSVDVNDGDKTGKIIHVGNLATRMLVTPDWEALLSQA